MRFLDARLDLDSGCNYRCVYCQNRPRPGGGPTHFPLSRLLRLLPILKERCWSVYLACGGEPTLHPDFDEIMRKHVPRFLSRADVFLVTNGFRLDRGRCEAVVEAGITRVSVSVDTVVPETYTRLCGCSPNALATVLGNVETLLRIRGKKKYPKVFLTSVAMKSTVEKLPDVCRWVVEAGLDGHRIQPMIPYDTAGMRAEDIAGDAGARAVFAECRSILSGGGVYRDIPLSFRDRARSTLAGALLVKNKAEYLAAFAAKAVAGGQKPGCALGGRIVRVDSAGNVKFCDYSGFQPGNLFDGSKVRLDRRVKNTYRAMRKGGMKACSAECPCLRTKRVSKY